VARRSARPAGWNRTRELWPTTIGALFLRDRGSCAYCGAGFEGYLFEIDHVRPKPARMHRNDPRNLVCACGDCNQKKGQGPVPEAARAEVRRRTRRVLNYEAGRRVAEAMYPKWFRKRCDNRNAKRRRKYTEAELSFDPAELSREVGSAA
jgi:hypothetical protein